MAQTANALISSANRSLQRHAARKPAALVSQKLNCSYVAKTNQLNGDRIKAIVAESMKEIGMGGSVRMDPATDGRSGRSKSEASAFRLYIIDPEGNRIPFSPRQIATLGERVRTKMDAWTFEAVWNHGYAA